MLYYNFNGYEGFKERFGIIEHGNGQKSRRNKILLSYVKQPKLLKEARETQDYGEINIPNMTTLLFVLKQKVYRAAYLSKAKNKFEICDFYLASDKYRLDENEGLCEDGDIKQIRYINLENNRVWKKKAGRLLNAILTEMGITWPEPVRLWVCEEFQRSWELHSMKGKYYLGNNVELYVNDNFSDIYDSDECDGDFGSCMVDDGQWYFYKNAVNAKAAYLRNNESGLIVARCIVFNEVRDDETGEIVRLAERQYTTDCDNVLKSLLVDKLIEGGYIDGYKKVGVDCHNNRAYLSNSGESWYDRKFSIECNLHDGDTLSYQDSFIHYNEDAERAYNYYAPDSKKVLNSTDRYFDSYEEEEYYDEYHDTYTNEEVITVYYHGREITTEDSDWGLEDFVNINGDYYHSDDCVCCPRCEEYVLDADSYYSELTGEYYCCEDCMEEAEKEYRRDNGMYSAYDDEYVDDESEVVKFKSWYYSSLRETGWHEDSTILFNTLQKLIDKKEVILCNGVYYEKPYELRKTWKYSESYGRFMGLYKKVY